MAGVTQDPILLFHFIVIDFSFTAHKELVVPLLEGAVLGASQSASPEALLEQSPTERGAWRGSVCLQLQSQLQS